MPRSSRLETHDHSTCGFMAWCRKSGAQVAGKLENSTAIVAADGEKSARIDLKVLCVEPRPLAQAGPPGGLPSGVWYTPAAAPLPAGAGEEARGPLDSGSPPLPALSHSANLAEIRVSRHLAVR